MKFNKIFCRPEKMEHKLSRTDQLESDYRCSPPQQYYIDSGNICNLQCRFCATGNGMGGRSKGFLSLQNYRRILEKISPYAKSIGLYNYGEPFLNQDIIPMVALAAERGINIHLSTNFNVTNLDHTALVRSGLMDLYVSIDGICQETYGKYRRGGNLELVLQNIEWLEAAKKQLHSHTPHIIWYYLVHKFNEHEIPQAKEMARKLGLSIAFELLCTWDETWDSSYHHTGYVPRYFKGTDLTEYHLADRSLPIKADQIKLHPALGECLCRQLFTTMVISWNGTVFPCSTANSDDFSLGNILTVDLVELWNNAGYRRCREYLYHYNQKPHIETVCNNNVCALKTRKVLY